VLLFVLILDSGGRVNIAGSMIDDNSQTGTPKMRLQN
jgi:hypothetical protein